MKSKISTLEKSKMSEIKKEVKINHETMADSQTSLGQEPVQMICPYCSYEMWTNVESKPSTSLFRVITFF